jgi:gamma-glutamylcyclotransferase (GGCT)/AIG2-like uncharacterized protein YtfP
MITMMFVYGTLRTDCSGWGQDALTEEHAHPVEQGLFVAGRLYSYHDSYPVADLFSTGMIAGELHRLDPESPMYLRICRTEFGANYIPITVPVLRKDGRHVQPVGEALCWHYYGNTDHLHRIQDGDWKKFSAARSRG